MDTRMKKPLSLAFVALLLLSIATVMVPVSGGVEPDANSIFVWPDSYTQFLELDTLRKCDTFTVDVMVNLTTGLFGFDYKLFWNSTNINLTSYTVNIPPEWGANWFKPKDDTSVSGRHWLGVSALAPAPPVAGVRSLCTYNFHVIETVWADEIGTLDLQDTILADENGDPIIHTTHDGEYRKCAPWYPVTWDWYDNEDNPIPLSAFVTISDCSQAVQNFSFSRWPVPPPPPLTGNYSLGYISFDITVAAPGSCNVTVPKLLMDGAFKVLIDDTAVPSILTWNTTHTFIHFTYNQGTHNIIIIGEMVTRFRGPALEAICDVNGDGIVDIFDVVKLGAVYGYKEYP